MKSLINKNLYEMRNLKKNFVQSNPATIFIIDNIWINYYDYNIL